MRVNMLCNLLPFNEPDDALSEAGVPIKEVQAPAHVGFGLAMKRLDHSIP
jgi:hypothetical protein